MCSLRDHSHRIVMHEMVYEFLRVLIPLALLQDSRALVINTQDDLLT
jgi:hypothetical protein